MVIPISKEYESDNYILLHKCKMIYTK
jgi:hypothetical protein